MASWDWRAALDRRPWWMNLIFGFCLYMTFIYMPYDMFVKPVAADAEVWFGILVHGWAAKLTEPLHWAIYAAGAYGFWKMRPWLWPWAALYVGQIGVGMLVWSVRDLRGHWAWGAAALVLFGSLAVVLWRARDLFRRPAAGAEQHT